MKYILKKEYPGSPKLNTICKYDKNPWSDSNAFTNPILNPKDYPEFWELVVEKDYEILSVITNNNKFIEKVYNQDATIEPYWKIHSVKRLSDGEIFTIGDKTENGIIKSIFIPFEFGTTTVCIQCDNKKGVYLKDTKKIKQSLFTTEPTV